MAIRKRNRIELMLKRWESLERLSSDDFERRMLSRIQAIADWHANHSPNRAYCRLLRSHGHASMPRLRSLDDVRRLPIVDKSFISFADYASLPGARSKVVCVETSGTTSSVVRVPHTLRSIRTGLGDSFLASLALGGLNSASRYWTIGHRAFPGQATGSFLSFEWLQQVVPSQQLLVSNTLDELGQQVTRAQALAPDLVASAPGFLTRVANWLAEHENVLVRPSVVLYGGAVLGDEGRECILRTMRPKRLVAFYPTTDCGPIGVSPTDNGEYSVFSETHYVEVVDAAGKPVEPGERGVLLATALDNRAAPLIRYRVGDEVTLVGSKDNRLVLSNIVRRGEVSLGDGLLPLADVQSWTGALSRNGHSAVACQLVIRQASDGVDLPVIRLATKAKRGSVRALSDAVLREFRANYQLANALECGAMHPPVVELFGDDWSVTINECGVANGASVPSSAWLAEDGADGWKQKVVVDER